MTFILKLLINTYIDHGELYSFFEIFNNYILVRIAHIVHYCILAQAGFKYVAIELRRNETSRRFTHNMKTLCLVFTHTLNLTF